MKIKTFWGQTENAVKRQTWIAVSIYVTVTVAKKRFMLTQTRYEILQIPSISIFEKVHINQLFQPLTLQNQNDQEDNQL